MFSENNVWYSQREAKSKPYKNGVKTMKNLYHHKATRETPTGTITAECFTTYNTPKKGDTIYPFGHAVTLSQDMEMGVNVDYDMVKKQYVGYPMITKEEKPRIVFYADGYSWRVGEEFTKEK